MLFRSEDIATDLNLPCAQTSEIDDVSGAPIAEFNSSIDLCTSPEIIHDENEPCVLSTKSDLDHIKLLNMMSFSLKLLMIHHCGLLSWIHLCLFHMLEIR